MKKIVLLFNTLCFLKWEQFVFRLYRKIISARVTEILFVEPQLVRPEDWVHFTLYNIKISTNLDASFIGVKRRLELPRDWNNEKLGKLWLYNLHYFEDLLAQDSDSRVVFHQELLERWVEDNPVGYGSGWEPYPTSLRVVNTIKAWLGGLQLSSSVVRSLFEQSSYLSNDLERHLLGNHLFVNYKALLFAGVVFDNPRWLKIAEKGLLKQIPEQILDEGLNFELTPMYHSLMLMDMLDMLNLTKAYPSKFSVSLKKLLIEKIPLMINAMELMSHPDGEVSFFNDSAIGIAPPLKKIKAYAHSLGLKASASNYDKTFISGYFCPEVGSAKLIFDAAAIGPDYIPGHAHADTLSFELSIGKERVIVNSGTSEYGVSSERLRQRSTCAHNTVEVDGKSSSQVWSGFRVAKRARVIDRIIDECVNGGLKISAKHNGYKSLFGGAYHRREILFSENCLILTDSLDGKYTSAISRLYFHPDLDLELKQSSLIVKGQSFKLLVEFNGVTARLNPSTWHPEFGVSWENHVLELDFCGDNMRIEMSWECS